VVSFICDPSADSTNTVVEVSRQARAVMQRVVVLDAATLPPRACSLAWVAALPTARYRTIKARATTA